MCGFTAPTINCLYSSYMPSTCIQLTTSMWVVVSTQDTKVVFFFFKFVYPFFVLCIAYFLVWKRIPAWHFFCFFLAGRRRIKNYFCFEWWRRCAGRRKRGISSPGWYFFFAVPIWWTGCAEVGGVKTEMFTDQSIKKKKLAKWGKELLMCEDLHY